MVVKSHGPSRSHLKTSPGLMTKTMRTNINLNASPDGRQTVAAAAVAAAAATTNEARVSVVEPSPKKVNVVNLKPKKTRRKEEHPVASFTKNKNTSKNSLVRIKGRIKRHIRKTFPRNIGSLFLKDLQPTWSHFLDTYGKGDLNLSNIERPQCFNDYGFMAPPEAFNESKRTAETKPYMDNRRWEYTDYFYGVCHPLLEEYNVTGVSISLLDRTRQVVKFSINHPLMVISRNVSLDGHAILSKGSFVILDASRDWRTLYNPMVHGPPFIRFYAAVPLYSRNNVVVGALAVFDPYIRCACPPNLIDRLRTLASTMIQYVDLPASSLSPRITPINSTYGPDVSKLHLNHTRRDPKMSNWEVPENSRDILADSSLHLGLTGLRKLNCNPSILHSFEISQELMACRSAVAAVERAAQILGLALGLAVTYIVEVRKTSVYFVPRKELASYKNGGAFDWESAKNHALGKCAGESIKIRLLGGHGLPKEEIKFDRNIHAQVLQSEYGMHFDTSEYYFFFFFFLLKYHKSLT